MSLVVHWHQRDVEATRLAPGDLTPRDLEVARAIASARELGLRVIVFPIVWVEKRAPGKWRGTLTPRDRDAWWSSYERFVLHYANLAEVAGAEWLSVGSELGSTETWQGRWYHLISRIQQATSASLVYSANWDHFEHVSFWRRLDAVGINGYLPIASGNDDSVKQMTARWRRARSKLEKAVAALERPLVITEVGYLSRDGGAVKPWDYASKAPLDLEEQRRAYVAFANVWRASPALSGAIFWDWVGDGGRRDRGYTPRGKPAESVVRAFFRARR